MHSCVVMTPVTGVRTALDLFGIAEGLVRQRLGREHPEATPEEIERGVETWLLDRPGAEGGDCPGRPRPLPR